eukprot:CAMPEP_0114251450 /NCGR_PEP_ID=MMETSP0058-20121206/15278_1 /TAXON_ID=36894 /ORGANISM="Pyramimonas parkeae, CCMP726" /LENGTH=217 /DNA_ID=CAMNT_0001365255 /DNA_START=244 /DNA_END=897 /DNA_ORIENTATION=-
MKTIGKIPPQGSSSSKRVYPNHAFPDPNRRSSLLLSAATLTVFGIDATALPARANIVVPPRSTTPPYEAMKIGEARREELEAEKGEIVKMPFGVRYRESRPGTGKMVDRGCICAISFKIFQANGTYIDSTGYGLDSKDDIGEVFRFRYGTGMVPLGLEVGMEGMQVGALRRIQIPPAVGWIKETTLPRPEGRVAQYRLNNHTKGLLLMEVELVRVSE